MQSVVNICGGVTGELSNHVSVDIFNHNGINTVLSACLYDCVMISSLYFFLYKDGSRFSSALASAILFGVALVVCLIVCATVTIILLMKLKGKRILIEASSVTVASNQATVTPVENYTSKYHNDIITNENVAYVVHSPRTDLD